MATLREIQEALANQDPPAVEPKAIEAQKAELKTIKRGIDQAGPGVDKCRQTGKDLIGTDGDDGTSDGIGPGPKARRLGAVSFLKADHVRARPDFC